MPNEPAGPGWRGSQPCSSKVSRGCPKALLPTDRAGCPWCQAAGLRGALHSSLPTAWVPPSLEAGRLCGPLLRNTAPPAQANYRCPCPAPTPADSELPSELSWGLWQGLNEGRSLGPRPILWGVPPPHGAGGQLGFRGPSAQRLWVEPTVPLHLGRCVSRDDDLSDPGPAPPPPVAQAVLTGHCVGGSPYLGVPPGRPRAGSSIMRSRWPLCTRPT